tara:strand:- start:248 stop:742 length:495 start_codon:yes stop_codon:yes gene_type:complete
MHFRQKLHEAYEAGYRSGLSEQAPPLPTWDAILQFIQVQIARAEAGQPQNEYALSMYDYDGDGVISATDFLIAQVLQQQNPNTPGGSDMYPEGIMYLARPLPPRRQGDMRLRRRKPDTGTKRKGKKQQPPGSPYFPGGGQKPPPFGGPYPPGGGRPAAPGGQGT